MDSYGQPIAIFYANLLRHGVTVKVAEGKLKIGGDLSRISPVYRDEIVRRKEQLIDLLGANVPQELKPFVNRVIPLASAEEGIGIANQMGIKLRQYPVQGGWMLFIREEG